MSVDTASSPPQHPSVPDDVARLFGKDFPERLARLRDPESKTAKEAALALKIAREKKWWHTWGYTFRKIEEATGWKRK